MKPCIDRLLEQELGRRLIEKGVTRDELIEVARFFSNEEEELHHQQTIENNRIELKLDRFQCELEHRVLMRMEFENWMITSLDVSNTGVDCQAVCSVLLDERCMLTRLNLASNNIGDDGLLALSEALTKNSVQLLALNLAENALHDAAVYHFDFPAMLQELNLSRNVLGNNAAQRVAELKHLVSLNLENNQIGRRGLTEISRAFNALENWTELLIGNNFGVLDSFQLTTVQWQLVSKQVTSLSVDISTLTLHDFAHPLAISTCCLESLTISFTQSVMPSTQSTSTAVIAAAGSAASEFDYSFKIFCQALCKSRLHSLTLAGFNLAVKGTLALSQVLPLSLITSLRLPRNNITNPALWPLLQACGKIQVLNLSDNAIDSLGALEIVDAIESGCCFPLHSLNLTSNNIREHGALHLIQALRDANSNLLTLRLDGNYTFPPALYNKLDSAMYHARVARCLLLLLSQRKRRRLPSELVRLVGAMLVV